MQTSLELQLKIKDLMLDLMATLYQNGITEVHMGGMMRLLGVHEHIAQQYDQQRVQLEESVLQELEAFQPPPAGTVFH